MAEKETVKKTAAKKPAEKSTAGETAKKPAAKKPAEKAASSAKAASGTAKKPAAPAESKATKDTAAKKEKTAGTIEITLVKSLTGRHAKHIATANSLGLKRIGNSTVQPDNPQTRGKIEQISYLVTVS